MSENTPSDKSESAADAEPAAPLNRAERRKQAKEATQPGHVGPQNDPSRSGRGQRPHTKRQLS